MKKILAVLLAILMMFTLTSPVFAKDYYGDINKDDKVNSTDALIILKYSVGKDVEFCAPAADVNNDGYINSTDALYILQMAVGSRDKVAICDCSYCSEI